MKFKHMYIALSIVVDLVIVAYLLFWPVPIAPLAWDVPEEVSLPSLAEETLTPHLLHHGHGPEDIEGMADGTLYLSLEGGDILRQAAGQQQVVANTQGRPLGLHSFNDRLYIADSERGVLELADDGSIRTLVDAHDGSPLSFVDDLDISRDGLIYFSDAYLPHDQDDWRSAILENGLGGRLFSHDLQTGRTTLLIDDLAFANGVALGEREDFVLVNETARYRIRKVWVSGPKAGQSEVLIDGLPGFPDGISRGSDGTFWLTLVSPRNTILDSTANIPFIRKVIARLPRVLSPEPERWVRILQLTEDGTMLRYFTSETDDIIGLVTSVQEHAGQLYLGSLTDGNYATVDLN